jgi:hypothetical protein
MATALANATSMSVFAALVQVCGRVPPVTSAGVLHLLRNEVAPAFEACTYGRVVLPPDSVRVVTAPVALGCANAASCPTDSWADAVDAVTRPPRGAHRVYVLPDEPGCGFGGLGYVGCATAAGGDGGCRVWVNGGVANRSATYVHELGHNLGLNHAKSRDFGTVGGADIEYGDASDAMGYCCEDRCFNAPHLDQLKTGSELASLRLDEVPSGDGMTYSLPSAHSVPAARRHYVIVKTPTQDIYVQYRKLQGKDAGMDPAYGDAVNVYTVGPGERNVKRGFPHSMLEARLKRAGDAWLSYDGLTVALLAANGEGGNNNASVLLKTVR